MLVPKNLLLVPKDFSFILEPITHIFTKDVSVFDGYVDRCAERELIENADLFWLVFWKTLYDSGVDVDWMDGKLSLKNRKLTLRYRRRISDKMEGFVDQLRTFYLTCLQEKRPITFLKIKPSHLNYVFRKDSDKPIILHPLKGEYRIRSWCFSYVIEPCLAPLSKFFRLKISKQKVKRKTFYGKNQVTKKEKLETREFDTYTILYQHVCAYTITPSPNPKRNDLQALFYASYVNQDEYCDVTLVAKDDIIKVHSVLPLMLGGDIFKAMLRSNMKEGLEKEIPLSCYSLKIVRQFVEYLYLGVEGLLFDEWIKTDFPVADLLHFAHSYSIHDLFNHCANYLSLVSTEEHAEMIQELAILYESDYLQIVASKLQEQKKKSARDDR